MFLFLFKFVIYQYSVAILLSVADKIVKNEPKQELNM